MSCIPCQAAKALLAKSGNIVEGYSNLIFKDEEIEKMAKARYEVCLACSNKKPLIVINMIQHYVCSKCKSTIKCPLDAKIRAVDEVCPIGNW